MHEDPDFVPCAFCRRLSVGHFVFESEQTVVFRDAHPLTQGHIHIVPRRHAEGFFEIPPYNEDDLWESLRQSHRWLQEQLRPDGYNIGINVGQAAGQTIPHANIHLIPRYSGNLLDKPRGSRWVLGGKRSRSASWDLAEARQSGLLFEDSQALVLEHPRPVNPGHAMVIANRETDDFFALPAGDQDHLWEMVRRTKGILESNYSPDGYNIAVDIGAAAGQELPLALIHIIPRYSGDIPEPFGVRWMAGEHSDYQKRGIGH